MIIEEIELQKLKQDYPDFFRRTSPKVIDFVLSEKTSEKIADIATKNGIDNEGQIEEIAKRIVWVLLGKLPSGNLALGLELWVGLVSEAAKKITDEINQFIASAGIKPGIATIPQIKPKVKTEKPAAEEPAKRPPSKDVYREPVE